MNANLPQNYFYAEEDADIYDGTIRLTTEPYDLLHEQVQRLVAHWKTRQLQGPHRRLLAVNIGCGTGMEAIGILKQIADVDLICIDLSSRMLAALRHKLVQEFGDETAGGRCRTVESDFRNENFLLDSMSQAGFGKRQVGIVVSVYALHHLVPAAKINLYRSIAELLAPGGVFICGDMYSFESQSLAQYAQNLEESRIRNAFGTNGTQCGLRLEEVMRLTDSWLRHSREENAPLPIHAGLRPNANAGPDVEVSLLAAAGFNGVEVPFRFFQNGIVWAEV